MQGLDNRHPTSKCHAHLLYPWSLIPPLISEPVTASYPLLSLLSIGFSLYSSRTPSFLTGNAAYGHYNLESIWVSVSALSPIHERIYSSIHLVIHHPYIHSSVFIEHLCAISCAESWGRSTRNTIYRESLFFWSSVKNFNSWSLSFLICKTRTTSISQVYHKDTKAIWKYFTNPELSKLEGITCYIMMQVHMPSIHQYIIRAQ